MELDYFYFIDWEINVICPRSHILWQIWDPKAGVPAPRPGPKFTRPPCSYKNKGI